MAQMRDAMTWEEVRRRVLRMMRWFDARREEASAFHKLSALEHAADAAALTLALDALDAVARVRALHHVDEHCWCAGCNNFVYRGCETLRALDGEADRELR